MPVAWPRHVLREPRAERDEAKRQVKAERAEAEQHAQAECMELEQRYHKLLQEHISLPRFRSVSPDWSRGECLTFLRNVNVLRQTFFFVCFFSECS